LSLSCKIISNLHYIMFLKDVLLPISFDRTFKLNLKSMVFNFTIQPNRDELQYTTKA